MTPIPIKPALLVACLAVALMASGCATRIPWDDGEPSSLRVGMSQAQVEADFGRPTRTFVDENGRTVWFYGRSSGPDANPGAAVSSREITIRFVGDRVMDYSHSTSTTTTTITTNP